jgi:hypothetical protein
MAGEFGEFDIRRACRNHVRYLHEVVDMLVHNYPDIDIVNKGSELGPCIYQTVFRASVSNPEDFKEVVLAVSRINQFIRDIKGRQAAYGWSIFEKVAHVDGGYVYVDVRWVKKIRLPGVGYATVMDIYELARPYINEGRGEGDGPHGALEAAAWAQ